MLIDFSALSPREAYGWMTAVIVPRPIAWVSTVNAAGQTNLAPFSFFQGVCGNPPTLLFTCANDRNGRKKDTILNIEETGEFVVSVVPFALAEPMNATAASLPRGESEFAHFGITAAQSAMVKPPRVADSPVAVECGLDRIVRVGEGALAGNVIFGRIRCIHAREDVLGPAGTPDAAKLDLIGRLGGEFYSHAGKIFSLKRPE